MGRQRQFEPLSSSRLAGTRGQAAVMHVERQLSKFRCRACMSVDVSFQGTAGARRENRSGQQWAESG